MKVVVSILALDNLNFTRRCVESVLKNSGPNVHLILTNNGSAVGVKGFFNQMGDQHPTNVTVVHNDRNLGFIEPNRRAFNKAVEMKADYFILLNNDMTVIPNWVDTLLQPFTEFPQAALSGPEGNCCHVQHNFHGSPGPFEYLEGSCLGMKVSVIQKIGLFPAALEGAYGEDSCLSLRVREQGYSIHRVKLNLPHARGATSAMVPQAKKWQEANHVWLKKRFAHYLKVRYMEYPIVIQRADAWGDVLLTTPIIRALRKARPLSPLHIQTHCMDVYRDNPYISSCTKDPKPHRNALYVNLNMAYERVNETHILDAYVKHTAECLGGEFEVTDRRLDLFLRPGDANKQAQFIPGGKVATMHVGPVTWRSKEWGIEKFQVVSKRLMDMGWKIHLVGSTRGAPVACTLDFRGATNIHQLAAIVGASNLFIGLDSFPLHVAQAMNVPAVGIFGITSSKYILTAPNAVGVDSPAESAGLRHRISNVQIADDQGKAIAMVTPEMVISAIEKIIA